MHKAIIIGLFGVSLAVAASVLPSFADEASQALLNGKVKTCQACDFSGQDLSGRELKRLKMERANFSKANLDGAALFRSNIQRANFSGASVKGADLNRIDAKYRTLFSLKLILAMPISRAPI